jgi:hypothetical protein
LGLIRLALWYDKNELIYQKSFRLQRKVLLFVLEKKDYSEKQDKALKINKQYEIYNQNFGALFVLLAVSKN